MRLLGAVLAGGRSSRFGSDKAQAQLGGTALVVHARASLSQYVETVLLIGPGGIKDHPMPDLGPLGGIAGALRYASAHGFDAVVVTACDIPILPSGIVPKLIEAMPAFLLEAPVVGCWPAAMADEIENFLSGSDRSMRAWARARGARGIAAGEPVLNINRPDDLDIAIRRLGDTG
jgi:molybdopterin-guanine dinucleotide biosynthesis protein A